MSASSNIFSSDQQGRGKKRSYAEISSIFKSPESASKTILFSIKEQNERLLMKRSRKEERKLLACNLSLIELLKLFMQLEIKNKSSTSDEDFAGAIRSLFACIIRQLENNNIVFSRAIITELLAVVLDLAKKIELVHPAKDVDDIIAKKRMTTIEEIAKFRADKTLKDITAEGLLEEIMKKLKNDFLPEIKPSDQLDGFRL